jgi:acyl carrier protein
MTAVTLPVRVAQIAGTIANLANLPAQHTQIDALGFDSTDEIEFTMTLEEEFEIDIGDEDAASIQTIADATALVEREMKKKRRAAA